MKALTLIAMSRHAIVIATQQRYGIGVPEYRRTSRQDCGFSHACRHGSTLNGRALQGGISLAGSCTRYANLQAPALHPLLPGSGQRETLSRTLPMERSRLTADEPTSPPGLDFEPVSSSPGLKVGCEIAGCMS